MTLNQATAFFKFMKARKNIFYSENQIFNILLC